MAGRDVFALENSELNPFLFATIGTEPSGTALTMLSLLGRLDADPWEVAGGWARLSASAAIDKVAETVARAPLDGTLPGDARAAAERLVPLLPGHACAAAPVIAVRAATPPAAPSGAEWRLPNWTVFAMLYCVLVAGIAFNMLWVPHVTGSAAATAAIAPPQTTQQIR